MAEAFARFEQHGLLDKLAEHEHEGNQRGDRRCYPVGDLPRAARCVKVSDVLIGDATTALQQSARRASSIARSGRPRVRLARSRDCRSTLTLTIAKRPNRPWTRPRAGVRGSDRSPCQPGRRAGARPASRWTTSRSTCSAWSTTRPCGRSALGPDGWPAPLAVLGMFVALSVLCGIYMRYRHRGPLASLTRLSIAAGLMAIAGGAGPLGFGRRRWRAELIPLLLFGMTMAIAYRPGTGPAAFAASWR